MYIKKCKQLNIEEVRTINAIELARLLNLHPETVRRLIREGEIKAIKDGRSFYIPEEEVQRLYEERNGNTKEDILEKLQSVEVYFKRDLEEMMKLNGLNEELFKNKMFQERFGEDVFNLVQAINRTNKIIKNVQFMQRYLVHGESLFETKDKNNGVTSHSKEVKNIEES